MSRDYYKYNRNDSVTASREILDNEPEFNANQFKLFDDFTTDLRISYNPLRNYRDRRTTDPNDSGVDMENGNPHDDLTISNDADLLENEVMVDPWSSMDSSHSPLTDSGPSASEDCTPSTSSEPPRGPLGATSPLSSDARRIPNPKDGNTTVASKYVPPKTDKARSRDLTLDLEADPLRRPHFLDDDDCQSSSKSNIECRIPKPHFLDHSPSPDEFDERSDITNPNFLDDEIDGDDNQAKKGALPKRPQKPSSSGYSPHEDRPHRTSYRTTLHYGLENAARSSERDKRASQLYRGTWPGERDVWTGHDSASVRSFSSNGSAEGQRPSSNLENKMECVCSLISLLSLSPENNADLSGPLLDMSRSVESCIAMRQAGCIPLLVQLIHSKVPRETRDRAAKALRNIIHTQTDDKAGRREARVWRLLEQVREYCYVLEDLVEARKESKETVEDDATKHPSQSVAALMKLSFDEEHRHVVCQLGGLQALAALVSGDQAAHGSRTDDNTCLTMRKYAGMTLTNLTFGDGNNKSLLCSFKDFMLALVEQLESPNDDMRQVTAAVLRNLSWRADTNSKLVLREVGAVKGLTKAAMTCQKEATLKSVLSALWNLTAHCSMNKVALCSVEGALGFLVDMLSYNSPTKTLAIVENAGGIMRNVSSHIAVREDYRQILRERNCLSVLLQHLKSPSLTVVSNSCGTLWNLSARCPQDQQFLWDHGAVPMLRSLIHSKHKMIAMGSGAALKNLLNSKPGKTHIISLDTTARSMNLPALPTLGARKQKALEQELDQNLAETCDNIEPATSPTTTNREEKNLFTATERQIAMNLERHRMTSSSPLMGTLTSQISLSNSAHLASYLSCSNTLLKGALVSRCSTGSAGNVNRSDSKDSVTSTHSDSVFERRTGKVPVPTPRNKDLMKPEIVGESPKQTSKDAHLRYPVQPPVPPPRSTTDPRPSYTESGFDVDQDSCDQPIDFSRKYSESKPEKPKETEKESAYGDYQETDLDQPTDYSLRYAEHQSETGSDSEPPGLSVHEDTIKHFATEGTPYETPIIFSTATSMSDLRVIGKDKPKTVSSVKENPEVMTHSDEKDTCSIEDPPRHDNDLAASTPQSTSLTEPTPEKRGVFDTKFSSGMISPEKPVNYCDEGTPGYFSRVSSLSSLGEPTEEDSLAKKNAMATINVDPSPQTPPEQNTSIIKDKEGSKAVTFASTSPESPARYVEETPLMFSRSSSLGSLPDCPDQPDDQGSVVSELSRMTSGCMSPGELPESPGAVSPGVGSPGAVSPSVGSPHEARPVPHTPPQERQSSVQPSVFSERVSQYAVEHTPAAFSAATSLSSLTIEPHYDKEQLPKLPRVRQDVINFKEPSDEPHNIINRDIRPVGVSTPMRREPMKECTTPGESCRVYCTEDTPALSKAGSHSDLSALSIESSPPRVPRAAPLVPTRVAPHVPAHDSSDSSNTSDAGDLLEECIQKGIAKVVKNKAPPAESPSNPFRDNIYRSLPPHLRAGTERGGAPSPPPLPPKHCARAAPLPPPKHNGTEREIRPSTEERRDSLSSLSAESFGSTDREIFEQTVRAGVHRPPARPRPRPRSEGPAGAGAGARAARTSSPGSVSDDSFGSTDKEVFERCVRVGMQRRARARKREEGRHDDVTPTKNVREPLVGRAPAGGLEPAAHLPGCDVSLPTAACDVTVETQTRDVTSPASARGVPVETASHVVTSSCDVTDSPGRDVIVQTPTCDATPPPCDMIAPRACDVTLLTACDVNVNTALQRSNECLASEPANTTVDSERDELNISNESYAEGSWSDGPDLHWTDIKQKDDTWNDNTCPDDVTFPTISGSVHIMSSKNVDHIVSSMRSEAALPDLLETSDSIMVSRPDLTDTLHCDSTIPSAIEREAARLAARLGSSYALERSDISLGSCDETSLFAKKQRSRKKSLPISLMMKRVLGSSERLEEPISFLDDVKPPSEFDRIDMESSILSVSSIVSEVADSAPLVFDLNQPVREFPLCQVYHDLDKVNPPSLFDEMAESTLEIESTTAQRVEECTSTLNVVTDVPSSENCTPLPSDVGSVESTPKKRRDPNYLTPKEKRHMSNRYQTYTISDTVTESDVVLEPDEFLTWTKSESEKSEEYAAASSEPKSKRKVTAKQRRAEDRARYQTQTVDINNIVTCEPRPDPSIESLKRRLAAKRTVKQKRMEDVERFRTRTLSEDIPPSPTFVTKDANFENVETTTGYDSLSSNEPNHQQISDERQDDDTSARDVDSGHNEDDFELNSTRMQTYTRSFRNYLPVTESPAAVDMCVLNNLKNIEMTASYRRQTRDDKVQHPSSGDYASYEGDSNSEDKAPSESDTESPRPKPKITKPPQRDESLDSNESLDKERDAPKAIRGRKKAMYVSPYRRTTPAPKKTTPACAKPTPKSAPPASKPSTSFKAQTSAKTVSKTPMTSKSTSANTSPKKYVPSRSPTKTASSKAFTVPPVATKPLPLERQGTFTKEESTVPAKDLPVPDKKPAPPRLTKSAPQTKANTSPSRLPQWNRYTRPNANKPAPNKSPTKMARKPETSMRNSASNHSLQSNESGKTVTIASRSSRQGSTSSVNSVQSTSKASAKDVESKIANLWKKVEQAKKQPAKPDKRVWIESDKTETPRLIRSSTFEGQPKQTRVSPAAKQKSAIGMRISQIPSLRPKSTNKPTPAAKKPTPGRVFARKTVNGQVTT